MDSYPIIPRIEDLPYKTSPPIEFVYSSTATLSLGLYTWADNSSTLVPNRPLMDNVLYYFRSITFSADIEELDFTSCIVTLPEFQLYLKSNANAVLFREPARMVRFMQNFDYRLAWFTQRKDDQLLAGFRGVLTQNANLVGKTSITLTAIISAQEIVDDGFIKKFKKAYPAT
jgi:hypothetical protein